MPPRPTPPHPPDHEDVELGLLSASSPRQQPQRLPTSVPPQQLPRSSTFCADGGDVRDGIVRAEIRHTYVKLTMQAVVTMTTLAFSAYMLASRQGVEGIYLPVVTGIVGFWLPSPVFNVSTKSKQPVN